MGIWNRMHEMNAMAISLNQRSLKDFLQEQTKHTETAPIADNSAINKLGETLSSGFNIFPFITKSVRSTIDSVRDLGQTTENVKNTSTIITGVALLAGGFILYKLLGNLDKG